MQHCSLLSKYVLLVGRRGPGQGLCIFPPFELGSFEEHPTYPNVALSYRSDDRPSFLGFSCYVSSSAAVAAIRNPVPSLYRPLRVIHKKLLRLQSPMFQCAECRCSLTYFRESETLQLERATESVEEGATTQTSGTSKQNIWSMNLI